MCKVFSITVNYHLFKPDKNHKHFIITALFDVLVKQSIVSVAIKRRVD